MPTTRRQAALQNNKRHLSDEPVPQQPKKKRAKPKSTGVSKSETKQVKIAQNPASDTPWMPGTIERGHIYFFFRPRVNVDSPSSLSDVRNFQMILVPRSPEFSTSLKHTLPKDEEEEEMKADTASQRYRIILIGKKHLPTNPGPGPAQGGKNESFWATITQIQSSLTSGSLQSSLGPKSYKTKTRGSQHEEPVRFVARGGYAIVNTDAKTPSKRKTHLGYCISHPEEMGEVQREFGVEKAGSFVLQVRNPLASGGPSGQRGGAEYPSHLIQSVFGNGKEGVRFAPCVTPELLDYENAQLLFIPVTRRGGGEEGLEESLGGGRGTMLSEREREEGNEPVENMFKELELDAEMFPAEAMEGEWV